MANKDEQRAAQAFHYCELLDIEAQNPGTKIIGMDKAKMRAKSVMPEPEIAWVEKQIAETYKKADTE